MTLEEVRCFLGSFSCERLTKNPENKVIKNQFEAPAKGKHLEEYLKDKAWDDDLAGETRVYLVKDTQGKLVLYFSLKCGLLYDEDKYDKLKESEKEYVDCFIELFKEKKTEELESMYQACMSEAGYEQATMLYKMGMNRASRKEISNKLGETQTTLNVNICYSAIEIKHLCRNAAYTEKLPGDIPVGFAVFWEKIVEKILQINELVGCKYLYLFAADNSESTENRKLVSHYKSAMNFSDLEDVKIIKPYYDEKCPSLVQEISNLVNSREEIWNRYSDVFE